MVSGQIVNFDKSEVCFGKKVLRGVKEVLSNFLGVKRVDNLGK